ncbi:glycoside hydrolase family 5 protein [Sphingorhabdus arenilitoris]|uniref:Glycoside hydrolase family 5 protein n=1 Tax=Sphingorhabdus arenilitoris TaxID=1490041 RepID=A0ABV8RIK4_9SPHN
MSNAMSNRPLLKKSVGLLMVSAMLSPGFASAQTPPPGGKPYTSVPATPIKRCANLGNMFEQPKGAAWGGRMPVEKDLYEIAAIGFDTVRFPIRWSAYADTKPPYTIDPDMFKRADEVVDWATKYKLNIIVDMHHYDELFEDPEGHKERFIALWQQVAEHYKDRPDSVLFEIINEPHKKLTNDVVEPMLTTILADIRKSNPTRKVIMGGDFWSGISSLETFDPPKDPNVIATFHFYEPFNFTHQGASWVDPSPPAPAQFGSDADYAWLDKMADATIKFQQRTGVPLFLGEFGAIDSAPLKERVRYTYAVRKQAEALNIGWCVWAYTNTFHVRRDDGWIPSMVAALGLPPEAQKNSRTAAE